MNIPLLNMAVGISSRFGTGIKQLEPVDAAKGSKDQRHLVRYDLP